ncbi:MAG: hypothetical protein ABIR68_00205 [Ilumatobacteraceae bacterium]
MIESSGIPTVVVATGRDLIEQVRPPRALFVNFPMGNNFGVPGAVEQQRRILRRALALTHEITTAGTIVDLDEQWPAAFDDKVERTLLAM